MRERIIHLLGGYTDHDMIVKFHEGLAEQASISLQIHKCNDHLVGAAYKNKMKSELSHMAEERRSILHKLFRKH